MLFGGAPVEKDGIEAEPNFNCELPNFFITATGKDFDDAESFGKEALIAGKSGLAVLEVQAEECVQGALEFAASCPPMPSPVSCRGRGCC